MYYGNRGIHPAVSATLTEGCGLRKSKTVSEKVRDPIMDDLDNLVLTEAQIDEGLGDLLKMATTGLGNLWKMMRGGLSRLFMGKGKKIEEPDAVKITDRFASRYEKDPVGAIGELKKDLLNRGQDPKDIDAMVKAARSHAEKLFAAKHDIKTGTQSNLLMAMANVGREMEKSGPENYSEILKKALKGGLGIALHQGAVERQQKQQQQQDVGQKPAAELPANAVQNPTQQKPKRVTKTSDGRFWDRQPVQAFDEKGQVVFRGRVHLIEAGGDAEPDGSYEVVSDDGKTVAGQNDYQWKPVDLKDSPDDSPDHQDPNASVAAGPDQDQQDQQDGGGPAPSPANPKQPNNQPSTTQALADPNAPAAPAPVPAPAPQQQQPPAQQPAKLSPAPQQQPAQPAVTAPAPTAASAKQRQRTPLVDNRPKDKRLGKLRGVRSKQVSLGEWVTKHFGEGNKS